jgi:HD-GYP domain-containing protein (c-di-GMP phosphodiesterase class II)
MVAYQMHERCNGSGYPRGRTAAQIHPLAKIAAVADVFLALVSMRPHRAPVSPYRAIEMILYDTQRQLYDPYVVRALLGAISLFPLGSYVRLSDDRIAKVIRTNPRRYDRPIVEIEQDSRSTTPPEVVDLALRPEVRVVRALGRSPGVASST